MPPEAAGEGTMRSRGLGIVLGMGIVAVGATGVGAFECPARIKDANDAIARAEGKAANHPDLALAKRWASEAQKAHQEGVEKKSPDSHRDSIGKAKAAKLLADKLSM